MTGSIVLESSVPFRIPSLGANLLPYASELNEFDVGSPDTGALS